jgi:hypothetical protein
MQVPDGRHAKTVEEFYEPNKKVVSIEGGHVVLEAFQLMRKTVQCQWFNSSWGSGAGEWGE